MSLKKEEKDELFEGIYLGSITVFNLPVNLYEFTANEYHKAVYKGYGKKPEKQIKAVQEVPFATDEWILLNEFRINTNELAAGKTFQFVREAQVMTLDAEGVIRPFNEFLEDVKKLDIIFNENWLKTERDTAIRQAQSARQWTEFEEDKDLFPILRYHTQKDERVRHSHAMLDGFTASVNDPYWGQIAPINSWNCRCWVEQLTEGDRSTKQWEIDRVKRYNKTVEPDKQIKSIRDIPDKEFKFNPAKNKTIFKTQGNNAHPYMKVEKSFEDLKKNNFNLDINFGR